ncbi:amino acid permease-domain-containing protein [Phellopilus nigrolimitatus]|nr:amino acid permease-domain-containing protein [Phellopilus nigrolimitatus]
MDPCRTMSFQTSESTESEGATALPQIELTTPVKYPIQPPSFGKSQYDTILRRQRTNSPLKSTNSPSRFQSLSGDFEFAGWGIVSYLELSPTDIQRGEEAVKQDKKGPVLGPWEASAVAANEVFGSVFYAFPPVVAASGVYSPISLLIATSTLFLWRPIIEELTSAFPISGANYTYLINVTSKGIALMGGALALLDYATTVVVSASTASAYISGEVKLPFPIYVGTLIIVVLPLIISLLGLRESTRTALGILSFHSATMVALTLAALVAWIRDGNDIVHENWTSGQPGSPSGILRQVFNGVCLGMIGMTGFECSPDYVSTVRPGVFPKVLRNIHLPIVGMYSLLMLLVLANIPLDVINSGGNILSVLADKVAGRWLRIWVVVDASIVLSAGVLTGILSACALCEKLARDNIAPRMFMYRLPATDAQAITITGFVALSGVLYASSGASLQIMSSVFALTWLSVMSLFPVSLLFLKFDRGRIPRTRRASLSLTLFTLMLGIAVFAGNIAIDPTTAGYFSAYAVAISALFLITNNKARILRWIYWSYDQTPLLHGWRWARRRGDILVKVMRKLRRQPMCVLAKTDEIHHLFRMISYVSTNEETSSLKLVHFYEHINEIPSEIEANAKLLDEAFPEITIDLLFVQAPITPTTVAALAAKLQIPRALMFISCPGPTFSGASVAELGTRIIAL